MLSSDAQMRMEGEGGSSFLGGSVSLGDFDGDDIV